MLENKILRYPDVAYLKNNYEGVATNVFKWITRQKFQCVYGISEKLDSGLLQFFLFPFFSHRAVSGIDESVRWPGVHKYCCLQRSESRDWTNGREICAKTHIGKNYLAFLSAISENACISLEPRATDGDVRWVLAHIARPAGKYQSMETGFPTLISAAPAWWPRCHSFRCFTLSFFPSFCLSFSLPISLETIAFIHGA